MFDRSSLIATGGTGSSDERTYWRFDDAMPAKWRGQQCKEKT
jgi:hypothetical protein